MIDKIGKLPTTIFFVSLLVLLGTFFLPQPNLRPVQNVKAENGNSTFKLYVPSSVVVYGPKKSIICKEFGAFPDSDDQASVAALFNKPKTQNGSVYYPLIELAWKKGSSYATVTCDTDQVLYATSGYSSLVIIRGGLAIIILVLLYGAIKVYRQARPSQANSISFDDFKQSMSELLEISPAEIVDLKDQLVDKHGNVPADRVLWFRDKYALRIKEVQKQHSGNVENQ